MTIKDIVLKYLNLCNLDKNIERANELFVLKITNFIFKGGR